METLKIAIASDWFYPKIGGIETHIHELALNLLKLGHEPHIITHDYRKYNNTPIRDIVLPYNVHRFRGLIYLRKLHVSLGPSMLWSINKLYKREKYDLTHIHSIYSPLAIAVANLSRGIREVPVVATNHSLFSWDSMLARLGLKLLRYWLKRIDVYIAVSRIVYNDTIRILGGNGSSPRVLLIPNAIDTSFWRPPEPRERDEARRRLGLSKDRLVVGVVGRFTRRKMIHKAPSIVYNAWRTLNMQRKITLIIAGDGELRRLVEEEASRYSRPPDYTVKLTGFVPREELRDIYWASDLVLIPSRYESFSITALEAVATGRVVVGFTGSGVVDIVESTGAGAIASSFIEASKAIASLLMDEDRRMKAGLNGVKRVQQYFSWGTVIHKIIDAYKLALDNSSDDRRFFLYKAWRKIRP